MLSYDFRSFSVFLIMPLININFRCLLVVPVLLSIFDILVPAYKNLVSDSSGNDFNGRSMNMKNGAERRFLLVLIMSALISREILASVTAVTIPVMGHAPSATPVLSTTKPKVGHEITVTDGFLDVDGDTSSGTTYQWYIQPGGGDAHAINGATTSIYMPVAADVGKNLWVKVIPRTEAGITEPFEGEDAVSSAYLVTGLTPSATNSNMVISHEKIIACDTGCSDTSSTPTATKATFTLKDDGTTPEVMPGQAVSFILTDSSGAVTTVAADDNKDGTYTALVNNTKADKWTVSPAIDGAKFDVPVGTLTKSMTVLSAALSGPESKVYITKDSALEGAALDIEVVPKDKFNNIIILSSLANPEVSSSDANGLLFSVSSGEATVSNEPAFIITTKPNKVTNESRFGTVSVKIGNVYLDSSDSKPKKLRWTPKYRIYSIVNGSRYHSVDYDSFTPFITGATIGAGAENDASDIHNLSSMPNYSFTFDVIQNVDVNGYINKKEKGRVILKGELVDNVTNIHQGVNVSGPLYVLYGYKQWSSSDTNPNDKIAAGQELCNAAGAYGVGNYSYSGVMIKPWGTSLISNKRFNDGPDVNSYGGVRHTREYIGIPNRGERDDWFTMVGMQVKLKSDGSAFETTGNYMSAATPIGGAICLFE